MRTLTYIWKHKQLRSYIYNHSFSSDYRSVYVYFELDIPKQTLQDLIREYPSNPINSDSHCFLFEVEAIKQYKAQKKSNNNNRKCALTLRNLKQYDTRQQIIEELKLNYGVTVTHFKKFNRMPMAHIKMKGSK